MQITTEHIRIYSNYGGDGDALVRLGTKEEKKLLSYNLWRTLEELLQNIELIEKDLVSDSFKDQILSNLKEACKDEETIKELQALVGKY